MNQRSEILEFYITNKKKIWNYIIIIGIIISIVCLLLISNEVYGAMEFCDSVDGIYKMDYSSLTHTCNGSPIYKYNPSGWSASKPY